SDDVVGYVTRDGHSNSVVLLDPESGHVRANLTPPDERTIQRLIVGSNGRLIELSARDVSAIDAKAGRVLWRTSAPGRLLARSACADDDGVYVATDDGRLLAFDFETGRPTWFASIGENPGEAGVWTALRSDLLF